MRGDGNAVPVGNTGLRNVDTPIRAEAHELIDHLPAEILVAMLPVLHRYAVSGYAAPAPSGPDTQRITIHHSRR